MGETPFDMANRYWFDEGRTARALAAYEQALRAAPDDPVVALQASRAFWSVDRFEDARNALESADAHRDGMSARGQRELDRWRERLAGPAPIRPFPELPPAVLDRDHLERSAPSADWRDVADAAGAREMFGLAAHAADRWGGVPVDHDDAKDLGDFATQRHLEKQYLAALRAGPQRLEGASPTARPAETRQESGSAAEVPPERAQPPDTPGHASASPTHRPPPHPALPLELVVEVSPAEAPIGATITLTAFLRNPAGQAVVVNRRMLLNHAGGPGEVWLDVDGPEGYRNATGFRVRSGQAPAEFFVPLSAGDSVSQSWALNDYQSLDTPGTYRLTLTYHNENSRAPDGRPMPVGTVSGTARLVLFG